MITFWVSDLYTWIRTAASKNQQLPDILKFNFDDKIKIPIPRTYSLTYMIIFWVSDLHTWIRMAASRIQQLPGVQKFISNDKIGIPITKKYII